VRENPKALSQGSERKPESPLSREREKIRKPSRKGEAEKSESPLPWERVG
jgi:hypothetical protein